MSLCQVPLPTIQGKLFLSAMPGRYDPFAQFLTSIEANKVSSVVCLNSMSEIQVKSALYFQALEQGMIPCPVKLMAVPDNGVPQDKQAYLALVEEIAIQLKNGSNILVHCGSGIGRTGTFAISILLVLGELLEHATAKVAQAGAGPEVFYQKAFVKALADQIASKT